MPFFTSKFPKLIPTKIESKHLLELVEKLQKFEIEKSYLLKQISRKKNDHNYRLIDEIIANVEEGHFEKINLIEWVYCLFVKSDWDQVNQDKSKVTSEKIWQFAQEYPPLKKRLFWHLLSFYFALDELTLAPSLAETFTCFEPQNKDDYITLKIIDLLIQENYADFAVICLNECLQPDQLLKKYSLPYDLTLKDNLNLIAQIQNYFPVAFQKITNPEAKQIYFLLNTLEKLSVEHQLIAVENLLTQIAPQIASNYPQLINWVKTIIEQASEQLSSASQKLFKKWIGAVNYKNFARLMDLIIDRISVDSIEANHLMQRKVFWSNYSDRLIKMRFLLPFSTMQALGNDFKVEEVNQLINDGSESTEVCIVDLDDYIVVEFLRAKGAEMRIFSQDQQLENELFYSPETSLKKLRYLTIESDNILDHCDYWQINLEQFLRSKNILPNEDIKYFKIVNSKSGIEYNFATGLPLLNSQQIATRNKQLLLWKEEIFQLNSEAKKYCHRQNNRSQSKSVLIFKNNQSLGNQKPSRLDFID
jgi:hypothetical protein